MKEHHEFKINWIGFPNTHRKVKGVYKIGNRKALYIGASIHIRSRILSHIRLVKTNLKYGLKIESEKDKYIQECLLEDKEIDVVMLSDDPNEEKYYHELFDVEKSHAYAKFYNERADYRETLNKMK